MTIESLRYPVLCFSQHLIRVEKSPDELTTCSKLALSKGGYFENLLLVDSAGTGLRVRGANKLHGVGLFFGYNIFLNQRIKVQLHIDGEPIQVSLTEVKDYVFDSFKHRRAWRTRGDFAELRSEVQNAASIPEIIELLSGEHARRR